MTEPQKWDRRPDEGGRSKSFIGEDDSPSVAATWGPRTRWAIDQLMICSLCMAEPTRPGDRGICAPCRSAGAGDVNSPEAAA
jgi:hypothetical protein